MHLSLWNLSDKLSTRFDINLNLDINLKLSINFILCLVVFPFSRFFYCYWKSYVLFCAFSIVICTVIMKYYRNLFWCFVSYITNKMDNSSVFSCIIIVISDFMVFFIAMINMKSFFAHITDFLLMIWFAFFNY